MSRMTLASFTILLQWFQNEGGSEDSVIGSISLMRIVRVARIVKLARVIRLMTFFRELRLMIYSILASLKSLVWVTLILGITFYIFGITFTSGVVAYLDDQQAWGPSEEGDLQDCFGSLSKSLLTLFMAISGGRSWGEYFHLLVSLPPQYPVLFLIFITFTIFAVLNIVTGVFVESAMNSNNHSRQVIIKEELDSKRGFLKALRDLFHEMDNNGDGFITATEFDRRLRNEEVIAYFKALKLDVSDTKRLFSLLDNDNSGTVDVVEFLEGCYQLQGEARSIDLKILQMQMKGLSQQITQLQGSKQTNGY